MDFVRSIFYFIYEIFFGCSHRHLTRPITIQKETYMVCLDCGSHVYYSFELMRPLSARELRRLRAEQAGEVRVMPWRERTLSPARKRARKTDAA